VSESRSVPPPVTWPCVRDADDALLFELSVVPGAKCTEPVGLHDGALRVRLAAPPVEGRANDALVAWIAEQLGLPRRDVQLKRGASSRRKQLLLRSTTLAHVEAWLVRICPPA